MAKEIETSTQTVHCLNCGTDFEGKFCPECGQSAETGRFTMRFIIENLLAAFTSKDGGVWYTLKNLFTRPGAMVVEILNGKRRRYFSPFPMLFCVLTVFILLFTFTGSRSDIREIESEFLNEEKEVDIELNENRMTDTSVNELKKLVGMGFKFYNEHYTAVFMLTLPLFLFATRAWYGKENRKRYYRAEYIVAIVYSMVITVLYRCLVSVAYLFSENVSDTMGRWIPLVIVIAFTACFRKMLGFSIAKTAWRSLLAMALYYIILGFIVLLICAAILLYILQFKYKAGGMS